MHRAPVVLVLGLLFVPNPGWAQEHRHRPPDSPIGPEFAVNTYVAGDQRGVFAAGTLGYPTHSVAVWTSAGQDGSGLGVFGRRLQAGPEFSVNTYTTGDQSEPSVAMAEGGNFVVVWASGQDGSGPGVFAQRYAAGGAPLGPEFRVNTFTTGSQREPRVGSDASGNFVVVWTSDAQDGSAGGVFGQRYAASGAPLGPEFRVNTYATGEQYHPAVSAAAGGANFVVVWQDGAAPGSGGLPGRGVFGQHYSSDGTALGPEFQVETYTTGFQGAPAVVVQPPGSFVVVWHSDGQDGSDLGIYGQRYASSGAPFGSEFRVNTYTTGAQAFPAIGTDGVGCFLVAWTDVSPGSGADVVSKTYVFGAPTADQFRTNTYTMGTQARPTVGALPSGTYVVAWESDGQDGSAYGVFGRIDNHFIPVELMTIEVE